MKEYNLLKELKEPSVIYQEDPNDPNNPEVLVKGVGRYRLKSLEKNVREKLEDLEHTVARTRNYEDWKRVQWMLDHAAMREMVKTVVSARREIEGVKEAFMFGKSAEEDLLGKVERLSKFVKERDEELRKTYARIEELETELARRKRIERMEANPNRSGSSI